MMPTEDQERNAAAQVERLERMKFTDRDGVIVPVFQGDPPESALSWGDLTPGQKETTLAMQINWDGFTPEEELAAIGDVIDGKGMDRIALDGRDALLLETFEMNRAIGHAGFRERFFDDPDAVREWPDPADREAGIRAVWDAQADFEKYKQGFDDVATEHLVEYRDSLIDVLADPASAHVEYHGEAVGRAIESREADPFPSPAEAEAVRAEWAEDYALRALPESVRDAKQPEPSAVDAVMEAAGNSLLPESIRTMESDYHKMLERAASAGKFVKRDKEIER